MDPQRIAGMSPFADLDDGERAEVAACLREVKVEPGTTLMSQGDSAYEFFVIEAGEAEVHKDGQVIATVGPGDVIGEIGMLVTGARRSSVVATAPMTLVAMFTREFKQVEKRMPTIAERLRAIMAERVARTSL